jgi:hypothetical protein
MCSLASTEKLQPASKEMLSQIVAELGERSARAQVGTSSVFHAVLKANCCSNARSATRTNLAATGPECIHHNLAAGASQWSVTVDSLLLQWWEH